ncbi:MAG: hypothetical protein ACREA2_20850 [Blastocatellia bacterium]
MQAWLDAFNSGDRGRIQAYLAKYDSEKSGGDPDIKVPASESLDVAKKMAAEQIKKAQR